MTVKRRRKRGRGGDGAEAAGRARASGCHQRADEPPCQHWHQRCGTTPHSCDRALYRLASSQSLPYLEVMNKQLLWQKMSLKTSLLCFNKEKSSWQPVSFLQGVLGRPAASASPGSLSETDCLRLSPGTTGWDSASQQVLSVRNISLFNNVWGWGVWNNNSCPNQ